MQSSPISIHQHVKQMLTLPRDALSGVLMTASLSLRWDGCAAEPTIPISSRWHHRRQLMLALASLLAGPASVLADPNQYVSEEELSSLLRVFSEDGEEKEEDAEKQAMVHTCPAIVRLLQELKRMAHAGRPQTALSQEQKEGEGRIVRAGYAVTRI